VRGAGGRAGQPGRPLSFGPSAAALILTVTVYSFASSFALDGVPDSENGLFIVMAAVVGVPMTGVSVASPALLLLARVAGLGVLASFVAIGVTRIRMNRSGRRA
jgi:hypothetical protein